MQGSLSEENIWPGVSSLTLERYLCPFVTSPRADRQNLLFCPFLKSVRRCAGWTHSLARRHWCSLFLHNMGPLNLALQSRHRSCPTQDKFEQNYDIECFIMSVNILISLTATHAHTHTQNCLEFIEQQATEKSQLSPN